MRPEWGVSVGGAWSYSFVAWLAVVALGDFRSRRVDNRVVAIGAALALVSLWWGGSPGRAGMESILMGCALVAVLLLPAYALGAMGAADIKVAGVLAIWIGGQPLLMAWVMAALLAMVHAVVLLARRRLQRSGTGPRAESAPVATVTTVATVTPAPRQIPLAGYMALAALLLVVASPPHA